MYLKRKCMEKKVFEEIMSGADKKVTNIEIRTNIARGLGLNGIKYSSFNTFKEDHILKNNHGDADIERTETDIETKDNYAIFNVVKTKIEWAGTKGEKRHLENTKVFVPYENIVAITYQY